MSRFLIRGEVEGQAFEKLFTTRAAALRFAEKKQWEGVSTALYHKDTDILAKESDHA